MFYDVLPRSPPAISSSWSQLRCSSGTEGAWVVRMKWNRKCVSHTQWSLRLNGLNPGVFFRHSALLWAGEDHSVMRTESQVCCCHGYVLSWCSYLVVFRLFSFRKQEQKPACTRSILYHFYIIFRISSDCCWWKHRFVPMTTVPLPQPPPDRNIF